jgi:hypothetical protein
MSAPAYARPAGAPAGEPDRQPRLFALPGGAEALPLPESAPQRPALAAVPAAGARGPRTLDSELRLAWTALEARAPAACFMCGGRMEPHAHAPGGACTSCGTSLDYPPAAGSAAGSAYPTCGDRGTATDRVVS